MKRLLLAVTILLAASQVWAAGGKGYVGPTAPATCAVGNFWIDTDGAANDRFYTCTATNTWTKNSGAGDDLGSAAYSDVVSLWTTCTGYLKSDGTCDTPSGSATYPSAAGVANWNGSAWGTSYTVGTAANNLVQLNGSAQLPAVSAALLTNFPTLNQNTTGTAAGLTAQYIDWNASSGGSSIANKPAIPDISGLEPSLGNPPTTGYVLSSTNTGVRSWIEMTGGGISHATSDGNYYASRNGSWASLAGVFQPASGLLGDIAGLTPTANYLLGVNSAGTDIELKSTLSIDVDLGVQSSIAAGRLGRTTGDQVSMGNNAGAATMLFSPTDDTAGNGSTTRTWSADKVYDELAVKAGLIASGTAALGTAQINSGACATAVTVTASGTATTDIIGWGFNGDPTSTTGYQASANGMLTIIAYPTSGNVNFRVCNNTAAAITPGAITLNWRVVR